MKAQQRRNELRVFGLNACLAVYARRPQAIRKVYLQPALLPRFAEVLRWCAARRVGYRLVGGEDLRRLTGSQHHEGVCFDVLRPEPPALADLLARLRPDQPAQIVCLDGVGNPHNLGAILPSERIAATPLRIGIPGSGAVESLNVSAAAAVLFAEHARQHGIQPLPPQ